MKQYIIIRNDKKIPLGKVMAHVGHNVLNIHFQIFLNDDYSHIDYDNWVMRDDMRKIVVMASLQQIRLMLSQCIREKTPNSFIEDVNFKYPICAVVGPVDDDESERLGLNVLPLYKG